MKTILIIEDEQVIAEVQKDYLEASGFAVEIAGSGDVGLDKALREHYDLILLDLMLPNVDGYEICRQIRETKNIPILMVSAKKEEVDKIMGLGLGADDYIIKPFSVGELVARVKAHLARFERLTGGHGGDAGHSKDQIRMQGLLIDKLSRKVFVRDEEIVLTTKEYDLLLYLATHPNRVFRKDELFERIWGLDSMGDNATVTVHISRLREKIERNPSKPQHIETIWGVGYRFNL
ncbi:Transcriptional regulatory protein SrrA [Paenibacillus sp. CECT 9249]|uniref:response regulator transcription factor n=1 Tax=Paenibacillus sp. CECT 9249 TaxID=2845385 RepID=UPI001E391857|nr:response regulator transcription factor [Paenibacillus sp. CECT 9249]CAH0120517.1 Transcriptional regulatory protein SrrA [Paenibacillus sp. CECT 9249]